MDIWEWHNWFAWYPVRINNKYVWLKTVQRICISNCLWDDELYYEYKYA